MMLERVDGDVRERVDRLLFASGLQFDWDICHGTNRLPMPLAFKLKLEEGIRDRQALCEYGPAEGPRRLRAALANWESVANRTQYLLDRVLITNGATEGLQMCFHALRARGRRHVLMIGPQFPTVIATAKAAGLYVSQVNGPRGQCYALDRDDVTRAVGEIAPDAVCLSLPMNPSGSLLDEGDLSAVVTTIKRIGAALVIDKVCGDIASPTMLGPIAYGALAESAGVDLYLVDAFSKRRSIPGLRIGYVVAPSDDIQRMSQMIVGRTVSTVPTAALMLDLEETIGWIHSRSSASEASEYVRAIWRNHATVHANYAMLTSRLDPWAKYLSHIDAGINCALSVAIERPKAELVVFEKLLRHYSIATFPISCFLLNQRVEPDLEFQIRVTCSTPSDEFRVALDRFADAIESMRFS